jgi:hypothetical protein
MDGQFFTLETLSSIAGMIAAIMVITQFSKGALDLLFKKICSYFKYEVDSFPTKLWVVLLSEIILFLVLNFNGQITSNLDIFLASINGLVLAGVSMESYDALQEKSTTTDSTDNTNS